MWETWVWSLGQEDPLEKEMAPHSSTIAWKIPWMEEPGRLQSMGSKRVGHNWATSLSYSILMEKLLSKWSLPVSAGLKLYLSESVFKYKWNWVYGHILMDYLDFFLWEFSTLNTELFVLLVFMNLLHILNTNLVQLHVKLSSLK